MKRSWKETARTVPAALAACYCLACPTAGGAQPAAPSAPEPPVTTREAETAEQQSPSVPLASPAQDAGSADQDTGSETDILGPNTFSVLLDARVVAADGHRSWIDGGLGKTRFSGASDGDFKVRAVPIEAFLMWQPQFTGSLTGNVSAGWQRDHKDFDLMEAYVSFLPALSGPLRASAKAGLYWPEISLEHATGGAWSTVYTITPSAINSWVGEEVKVLGGEVTLYATLGQQELNVTGGIFGYNDTSGTLLSFRGWALHDAKATAWGYFRLPPLNEFVVHFQEYRTKSFLEIDNRAGFYGRAEWRPPWPFLINVFYYDNMGDPRAFTPAGQWGWRTRFWNVGLTADLGPSTRLIAQGMTGTTLMGFETNGVIWIDTRYRSAFALVTHDLGQVTISARGELFETVERGSGMDRANESEDGWALTAAGRLALTDNLTLFLEALHVRSDRGTRRTYLDISPVEHQTVLQTALRFRW